MSRKNAILLLLLGLFLGGVAVWSAGSSDQILRFYWTRARAAFGAVNPITNGARFSFVARSYDKRFQEHAGFSLKDSLIVRYFYSFGAIDSSQTVAGNPHKFPPVDLSVPDVFDSACILSSFPNDTGGTLLPIGFDNDTPGDPRPAGLVELDRGRYLPRWLYLYYPDKRGYRRFTRSFRFVEREGLVWPDSVWEVSTQDGLIFTTHRRIETGIADIKVYH